MNMASMTFRCGATAPVVVGFVCLTAILITGVVQVSAQQPAVDSNDASLRKSDGLVLDAIFQQQHLSESGISVCDHARALPEQHGFEFLLRWVLPNDQHRGFRVTTDFVSANAAPATRHSSDADETDTEKVFGQDARIESPAIELIRLADKLDQTDTLRDSIKQCPVDSVRDQCNQTALLALLAIECDDTDRAAELLENFFALVLADNQLLEATREATLLCADQATRSAELSAIARESVQTIIQHYIGEVTRKSWHRHLWAVNARLIEQADIRNSNRTVNRATMSQWHAVSRTTAFEHGSAFPAPQWQIGPGSARNLSSLGDDFLFYASPLQGTFDVETEVTGFGYRDSHLMVGGIWVSPIYDHKHYAIGNVRGELERVDLTPAMSDTHSHGSIHYRTRVRSGVATTFFNGRKIHDQTLSQHADPWLAVRSAYRHDGGVDDLRITGTPTIPNTIPLIDSPLLLGWYDYFQSPGSNPNRLADWQGKVFASQSGDGQIAEISSPRDLQLPAGCFAERLLVYTRPMIEDGTIHYQFWFAPGETIAHPALGHHCFLLAPGAVRLHRLTDGRFERSTLRPDNESAGDEQDAQTSTLPLRPNAWNEMRLELNGDALTLRLNGTAVLHTHLQLDRGERTFGLFHFADQTNLRVRSPLWTGDWRKQLPPLQDQELAVYANEFLDRSAEDLPEKFIHHFDQQSLTSRKFNVVEGNPAAHVKTTSDGVVIDRGGEAGYRAAMLSPVVQIGGDFDVIARFDQLKCESALEKLSSIRMNVIAANDANDFASVIRAQGRSNDHMVQCLKMQTVQGSDRRHYFASQPMEGIAGRLRLARRGSKIYYLIAENDSAQFRLIGEEDFTTDDLRDSGIQFGVQTQGVESRAKVRFSEFTLRAERLSGLAVENQAELLAKLNEQRQQLPVSFEHDFTTTAPAADDIYRWTDHRPWNAAAKGLRIIAPGTDPWTSAGMSVRRQFFGDFDVTFSFNAPTLATPKPGKHSQVYLQIELDDSEQTQLSSMLTKKDTGEVISQAQLRSPIDGGYRYQNLGSVSVSTPDYLRVLRRDTEVYFLAGTESDDREYLIGAATTSTAPIDVFGVRILLHTGGAGRESQVLVKSIHVNAENSTSSIRVPETRPPKSLPGQLFDSFRDLFR